MRVRYTRGVTTDAATSVTEMYAIAIGPSASKPLQGIRVVGVSVHFKHTLALAADRSVSFVGEGPGLGINRAGEGQQVDEATRSPQRIPDLACMVPQL
jgi:hypothetical protein